MRSLQIHPLSALVGLGLAAVCLVSMSQSVVSTPLKVEYLAHPRDMVQIRGGTPYTVPANKVFVLTALGNTEGAAGSGQIIGLLVNGQREIVTSSTSSPSITTIPVGFTAPAGSVVALVEVSGSQELLKTRAWGYLAPQ